MNRQLPQTQNKTFVYSYDGNGNILSKKEYPYTTAEQITAEPTSTAELELFGWQIEFGVSGDLLSVGAEAMIGVFPDEGFTAKASVGAGLFGGGFVFRVKPKQ